MKEPVQITRHVSRNTDKTPAIESRFGISLSDEAVAMFQESATLYKTARDLFEKACDFAMSQLEEVRTNKHDRMKLVLALARPICLKYMNYQQFDSYAETKKKMLLFRVDRKTASLPVSVLSAAADAVLEKKDEYKDIERTDAIQMEAKNIREKSKATIETILPKLNAAFFIISKLVRNVGGQKDREAWQIITEHFEEHFELDYS
jgi:hypothetical protein